MMELTKCIESTLDSTKKYVFTLQDQEVEFSYIHKNDGKDIIVCPSQTSCNLGCTFCFLTGTGLPVINLSAENICDGVIKVIEKAQLPRSSELLLSFMGSGEPLLNYRQILKACHSCQVLTEIAVYDSVRFAVATMIPSAKLMAEFTWDARDLPLKLHLSLHSPDDETRHKLMPAAINVKDSFKALQNYAEITGNPVEIHYTLIKGINDRDVDVDNLIRLNNTKINIKFLDLKVKEDGISTIQKSSRTDEIRTLLSKVDIPTEFYNPPGSDIGSSCGQFVRNRMTQAK